MPSEDEQLKQLAQQELEPIRGLLEEIAKNTSETATATSSSGSRAGGGTGGLGSKSALSGKLASRAGLGGAALRAGLGAAGAGALAGGPAGLAIGAAATVGGAFKSAVVKPASKIVKDTVFNGLRTAGRFGSGVNAFQGSFNQALSNIPLIGSSAVGDVLDPIKRAGQRTSAITSLVARGGGAVSDEFREKLFEKFKGQEKRAQAEGKAVDKIVATESGSVETTAEIYANLSSQFTNLIGAIQGLSQSIGGP